MQGTRYNVPLLNALVFFVGIEVRFKPALTAFCPAGAMICWTWC